MTLARLAGRWVVVAGAIAGVIYLILVSVVFGLILLAFFGLSAYLLLGAARRAQRGLQATGRPTGQGSLLLLGWGQILILASLALGALTLDPLLVLATLPPGLMAVVAGYQLRRRNGAHLLS